MNKKKLYSKAKKLTPYQQDRLCVIKNVITAVILVIVMLIFKYAQW